MAASKALTNLCDNLSFNPNKKQFKWNGDLNSLKDFWIAELEEGKIESLLNVESKGSCEVLKFETVTVNFYPSTKTLQAQGPLRDEYSSKLKDIIKDGSVFKEQNQAASESSKVSAEVTEVIIADSDPLLSLKSAHDDRYEEFEAFMKAQREFNNKIESHISMNSVALNENVIELQDLEHKCKNLTKKVKLSCERRIEEVRSEIGEEIQKLVKQIASLNSKLSSKLKILKDKASSMENSIKLILHQLDQIKTKACSSEQSLMEHIQETSATSTRLISQEPATPRGTETSDPKEVRTYAAVTSNRYESLAEENRSIEEPASTGVQPVNHQSNNQPAATTSSTPKSTQPQIQQHTAAGSNHNLEHKHTSNGPVLLLGDSILRGIQQRKFMPNRYVNKQTITGGTREMNQYIEHMQDRNDYDRIVVHSGTNNVNKLNATEITRNMESCINNLKARWPNARIALSGLTHVPREENRNRSIDEINCYYESLCENLDVTFINNKRVTSDIYGNINEQVFYDDIHLNNRIGTRKLVTNIKHHLGLRGRNVESLPRASNTIVNRRNTRWEGPTRTQELNVQHQARRQISQPLQALNFLAEYLRESEMLVR